MQTIGFFNNNLVMEYGHEQAVADGVNVGFDVYRIRTRITEQGATLEGEPGRFIPHRDRRTRARRYAELDDDLTYTANQLDRDVVAEDQIRLVVRTFRDRLFTQIFPGRTEVPKTLVFAKDDSHAEDITRILREEFGKGNDFAQKITYRTTGKKPEELLAEFRNSYNPRIAVTVDMIATGTDVKPLECLLFMRNVKSAGLLRADEGAGRAGHRRRRPAERHARRRGEDPLRHRRCRRRLGAGQDGDQAARPAADRPARQGHGPGRRRGGEPRPRLDAGGPPRPAGSATRPTISTSRSPSRRAGRTSARSRRASSAASTPTPRRGGRGSSSG